MFTEVVRLFSTRWAFHIHRLPCLVIEHWFSKFPVKSTSTWENCEHKTPVNFKNYSDFDCFHKHLHPLDSNDSIEKHNKLNIFF